MAAVRRWWSTTSALGAANCHPIYNALDPETHHPVPPDPALECDLLFVGHRLPDRERRVRGIFLSRRGARSRLSSSRLGGEGWGGKRMPANVRWIGHVGTGDHNRVNCSARMVLNINRDSMAGVGFSPPTRVFEAAGAGACLITDRWTGIEQFFEPEQGDTGGRQRGRDRRVLAQYFAARAQEIGENMRERALRDHTYALRAKEVDAILERCSSGTRSALIEENFARLAILFVATCQSNC